MQGYDYSEEEKYDFADAPAPALEAAFKLGRRYSLVEDRKVFIVRIVRENTMLLRKITDINEGGAICPIYFF